MQKATVWAVLCDALAHVIITQPSTQVANALGVLASMQADLPSAIVFSDSVLLKAERAGVRLSSLVQRLYRNELLRPLLQQRGALETLLTRTPAWRAHLAAIADLNEWHSMDAMLAFVRERADSEALRGRAGGGGEPASAVAVVGDVIADLRGWRGLPRCQAGTGCTWNVDVWLGDDADDGHVSAARGGLSSSWEHDYGEAHDLLLQLQRTTEGVDRLSSPRVAAFAHLFKLLLNDAGCLSQSARAPVGVLRQTFSLTPGCAPLRDFLKTPAGRDAFLRQHAGHRGLSEVVLRWASRLTLLVRAVRDAVQLGLEAALVGCRWYWHDLLASGAGAQRQRRARDAARAAPPVPRNQTLYEWMSNTDPWTVFGTTVAACLAVLRVMVRLTSAFSTAATVSPGPLLASAPAQPPITPASAQPALTAAAPATTPASKRAGSKRSAKGRQKQRQKAAGQSRAGAGGAPGSPRAGPATVGLPTPGASPASTSTAPPPGGGAVPCTASAYERVIMSLPPPVVRQYDAIAARLRQPLPEVSQLPDAPLAGALTSKALSQLQSLRRPHRLARLNPELIASIRAVVPHMVRPPFSAPCTRHASQDECRGCVMHKRQAMALAQLQLMQKLGGVEAKNEAAEGAPMTPSGSSPLPSGEHWIASDSPTARAHDAPQTTDIDVDSDAPTALDGDGTANARAPRATGTPPLLPTNGSSSPQLSTAERELSAKLQMFRMEECGAVPELFLCPISRELMEVPVLAMDGHIYDRSQIESWLRDHRTSPMTNMAMGTELAPVLSLRSEIQSFKQRFPHLL